MERFSHFGRNGTELTTLVLIPKLMQKKKKIGSQELKARKEKLGSRKNSEEK
jgi:hypothetical protein